jgi:hypothetical protein
VIAPDRILKVALLGCQLTPLAVGQGGDIAESTAS